MRFGTGIQQILPRLLDKQRRGRRCEDDEAGADGSGEKSFEQRSLADRLDGAGAGIKKQNSAATFGGGKFLPSIS